MDYVEPRSWVLTHNNETRSRGADWDGLGLLWMTPGSLRLVICKAARHEESAQSVVFMSRRQSHTLSSLSFLLHLDRLEVRHAGLASSRFAPTHCTQ